MTPSDPRFLDATRDEIILDYWTHYYEDLRLSGKEDSEEFEDTSFDAEAIIEAMASNPDDWMDVI